MATAAELNVSDDILEGEDTLNLEDIDENAVLGDDEDEKIGTIVTKQELDGDVGDDLYDSALEPSGTLNANDKRESAEIQSSLPSSVLQQKLPSSVIAKSEYKFDSGFGGSLQPGKRFCCYIGNMTWWTTDAELEKVVKGFGIDDLIDIKFYENRNNGQSKGFALAVFASEASVKMLMEKLPNKKVNDQALAVLPYTKQSLAKLEEATKRYDQKGGPAISSSNKEEKVVNIGTIRIGANGAPVPQLMSSINLAQLARPVTQQQQPTQQPTSLLSLNFSAPPMSVASSRPAQAVSVGGGMMVTGAAAGQHTVPPGTPSLLGGGTVATDLLMAQQQQQQMAAMAAAAQQQQATAALLLQQQQQQQNAVAAAAHQQRQQMGGVVSSLNMAQPPPSSAAQQLQHAMSRPPPSLSTLGMNTAAPPPIGMGMSGQLVQQQQYRQQTTGHTGMQQQIVHQPPPGFPPGAHINPQVYPGYAHGIVGGGYGAIGGGHVENGAMISEAEFQEIMSRNQTVSSSAIHRALSDTASGDFHSAVETLVTAISLIRQSRVAHDDRCKLLINTLQDTLNSIESKSYSSGGGSSRKHRRERSRSPIRTKRHRRSHSRSRSRDRGGGYEYSPVRHSLSRRY